MVHGSGQPIGPVMKVQTVKDGVSETSACQSAVRNIANEWKSIVSIHIKHPMRTVAGMGISQKTEEYLYCKSVRGLRRWRRIVLFRCCLLPPASRWQNIRKMGQHNPPTSTSISGRQHGVTPLTMVSMRWNCLFQTDVDHTDNTKYCDVIRNWWDFQKLRPFCTHLFVVTMHSVPKEEQFRHKQFFQQSLRTLKETQTERLLLSDNLCCVELVTDTLKQTHAVLGRSVSWF